MAEKTYKCAYPHCLHLGVPVSATESLVEKGKHYHWDCLQTKHDIAELKSIYYNYISDNTNPAILSKVLNDLIFRDGVDIDYIKFILCYVSCSYKTKNHKIASPFTLNILVKDGEGIRRRYETNADWWWDYFKRHGIECKN